MDKQKEFLNACIDGNLEEVKKLHTDEIDINADKGRPIIAAMYNGHRDIVKYLLDHDVDVSIVTEDAFNWARSQEYFEIIDCVTAKKEDSICNRILKSLEESDNAEKRVLNTMKEHLDDNRQNDFFLDTFLYAARIGDVETIDLFYENDINVTNYVGDALVDAASSGHLKVVEYLVKKGVSKASKTLALELAAENGEFEESLEIIKYLHKEGANICDENNYALRWASDGGYIEIVKYLWENGSRPSKEDDRPVRWAISSRHWDIAKFYYDEKAECEDATWEMLEKRFGKEINLEL